MEYTKGEWKYTEELRANMSMISGEDNIVCGLPNPIPSDLYDAELVEMRANAHLIAAAPLMYEALKGLLRDYSSNPIDDAFFEACLKAREALAKAEEK